MVSRSETARPLLTPGEVMQLPPTDESSWSPARPPIRAKKARYYEDETTKPPPEFEFGEDEPDEDAVRARALRAAARGLARQAALDPGDGIDL
jgi:type IV secretion system protein VirD4